MKNNLSPQLEREIESATRKIFGYGIKSVKKGSTSQADSKERLEQKQRIVKAIEQELEYESNRSDSVIREDHIIHIIIQLDCGWSPSEIRERYPELTKRKSIYRLLEYIQSLKREDTLAVNEKEV